MYWTLSQALRDDRINCIDFGAGLSSVFISGYEYHLREVNFASYTTACLARDFRSANQKEGSIAPDISDFLPYPQQWAKDKNSKEPTIRVSEKTKAFIKKYFKEFPLFMQVALEATKSILS